MAQYFGLPMPRRESLISGFKRQISGIRKPITPPSAWEPVPQRSFPRRGNMNTFGPLDHPGTYIHPLALQPIDRLPNELLHPIFMLCYWLSMMDGSSLQSAIILSHVCRRWRAIALRIPLFWSHISVGRLNERILYRIKAYLTRSQNPLPYPLSLDIEYPGHTPSEVDMMQIVLGLLLGHCDRWRNVRLSLSTRMPEFFARISGAKFPMLESLELTAAHRWEAPENLSWAQLTSLTLNCPISGDSVFELLSRCPNLTYLNLKNVLDTPISPASSGEDSIVVLRHLKVLYISADDAPSTLYGRLCFPALEDLTLANNSWSLAPLASEAINSFLHRSGCTLLSFTLSDPTIVGEDLPQWLRLPSLQTLTQLNIQNPSVPNAVIDALCLSPEKDLCLMTRLEHLEFSRCEAQDMDLLEMAMSRCKQLRTFDLPEGLHAADLKTIKATLNSTDDDCPVIFTHLEKAGMRVDVSYADIVGHLNPLLPFDVPFM